MYRILPAAAVLLISGFLPLGFNLQAASEFVSYEDFGARGDGETDDFEAIAKAHEFANKHGRPVKARNDAHYYIGGADRTISIRTNTDFGEARFTIDDRELENHAANVFSVESELKPVKIKDVDTLSAGQTQVYTGLLTPSLVTAEDNSVRRFIRRGKNQNKGSKQTDTFLVDRYDKVNPATPIVWDFKQLSSLTAIPIDQELLTLSGGVFTTIAHSKKSTNYHARGIAIRRSNVVVEGLQHHITGEGEDGPPYRGFINISGCANVVIKNTVLTGHKTYYKIGSAGKRVAMGSYDITIHSAVNVALVNVTQTNDILDRSRWGIIGTNFCKNLLFDGCELSRFDAHQGVCNALIRDSTIGYMGVLLTGFGTFRMENSTVKSRHFIGLRPDYGSTWTGVVVIKNCRFVCTGRNPVVLDGFNDGQHDFGYSCQMPTHLLIDALEIADGEPSDRGRAPVLFANFNPKFTNAEYKQPYPYQVTQGVILKNVTTTSGRALRLSDNDHMFKEVKIEGMDLSAE